jgi:hypothetical protein
MLIHSCRFDLILLHLRRRSPGVHIRFYPFSIGLSSSSGFFQLGRGHQLADGGRLAHVHLGCCRQRSGSG